MKHFAAVDKDLLRKYSGPGPRYTSYPTAPAFTADFGPDEYLEAIERTNAGGATAPLSLYFHFPFCDTLCYFCGCTMIVTRSRERIREYNAYLKREVELIAPMIREGRPVAQLHWGGGTPSYLDPEEIRDAGKFIRERFQFDDDIEAGVEIDPRGLTFEHMQALSEAGFNRISMGVQDFDPRVQQAVNRIQPAEMTMAAIDWSRRLGFRSINIDLIYGLPFQTPDSFASTVDRIIAIAPDRLAVFHYAHVPWLKSHQKLIRAEDLPSADTKLEIFKMATEKLLAADYWNVGMDHFSKKTDELALAQQNGTLRRNFQGYSTKSGCDIYGFGMSAIGQFQETYQQNRKDLRDYYGALDAGRPATHLGYRMTRDDHIRKDVIMKLMCDMVLDKKSIQSKHDLEFDSYFASSLRKLGTFVADGLVSVTADRIAVHGMGRLVIRNIAMCFDAYIDSQMKEKPIFSRTV